MTSTPIRLSSGKYLQELHLLEQIHMALGSASKLDDFYVIAAGLLVDPNTFGFSRAFFIRYDDRTRNYTGRLALGARNAGEHQLFRDNLLDEERRLNEQVAEIKKQSPEPFPIQRLYDLRFHGLWIQLLQGQNEGTGLNAAFQEVVLRKDDVSQDHLLEKLASQSHAAIINEGEATLPGLENFITLPAVAGRMVTKRGLHGILIADRLYEGTELDTDSLIHFQWLLNHASVTLDNVELVAELTETTLRLQEVDRLKTNFLSIISHELRTPLTSIIGFVHLLSEGKVGEVAPAQLDLLRRVGQQSGHLQIMVNDLLEIAEVEAGGMINVALHPIDPLEAVLKVIPKVEQRRLNKKVTIEPVLTERIPMVRADSAALERILFHLMDNAVKFITGQGKVTIEFTRSSPDHLDITIADSGIGIPEANLKRIFDHFYQVDFRLERVYGGMGIGLSVVKMLLDATEGKITVDSSVGKGSRFTLTYPVAAGNGAT